MDKRSWPWKKKSSDKAAPASPLTALDNHVDKSVKEDKKPKYVQISVESYNHLAGLEDQVKDYQDQVHALEDEISDLNERLSEAYAEITNKDNLVKQHTKVAEDAVSGWEKADAEASALKNHLDAVTLTKLAAEERASHLDDALKNCMRQILNLKEENNRKLQEVALNKEKLFDKMKLELEGKLFHLDQEFLRAAAENSALSRSLQEQRNMLIRLGEEKSQAEAQIELLKSRIETSEKEVNSLKYELHIARKEAEIRKEEKNMSVRSAEVANKQYLEGVKKIAKLEAECQRLRGLVRKKLPGPAALAQMKLEVVNLGRDYGDSHFKTSPGRFQAPELSLKNTLKYSKENDLLTERLVASEEETKVLKETLAKLNSELQSARSSYAVTASKLQSPESELQASGEQLAFPKADKQPSLPSLSEEGIDDSISSPSSWSTGLMSELSHVKRERKLESSNNLELMDDFLEMEKLAYSMSESNGSVSDADVPDNKTSVVSELANTGIQPVIFAADRENSNETASMTALDQEFMSAMARVCEFIRILGREAKLVLDRIPDGAGLSAKIDLISVKYLETVEINPAEFVSDISLVFSEASKLHFNFMGLKRSDSETSSPDCIDKVALLESKAAVCFSDTCPDVPNDASLVPAVEASTASWKCSLEEFEQLKMDKEHLTAELERSIENYGSTKLQLKETEILLAEVNSQLSSSQKSNSLADTQLKCMTESYKSLESRAEELETEVIRLQGKVESLENELQEVRRSHQEALTRCKNLQDQLERGDVSAASGIDEKTCQDKELAAATEKLAECQETIYLLGKQLKSFGNQTQAMSPQVEMYPDESTAGLMNLQQHLEIHSGGSLQFQKAGLESPLLDAAHDSETYNFLVSPVRSKQPQSSSMPEKQARGFTRLFSSSTKGRFSQQ